MPDPTPTDLLGYAERLLTGTGLDAADALAAVRSADRPGPAPVVPATARVAVSALRDGWLAARRHRRSPTAQHASPAPDPEPGPDRGLPRADVAS